MLFKQYKTWLNTFIKTFRFIKILKMDVIVKVKKVCPWVYIFKKRFEQPSRTDLLYMEILKDASIKPKKRT